VGQKLPNPPIYYSLAKVRFGLLPKVAERMPDVQEALRIDGYPDPFDEVITTFDIDMTAPQPRMQQKAVQRWVSLNAKRTAGFLFDSTSLTYQTTDYEDSESFVGAFTKGLRVFHSAANIQLTERIGVRTLDAVFPKAGEPLSDYVDASVLGLFNKLDGHLQHSFSETVLQGPRGLITSRAITQNGGIAFPPDLQNLHLTLPERITSKMGIHTMIDTDASRSERGQFNVDLVSSELSKLKKYASESFWKTVTKEARERWSQP
jgi:uncharacterized protein (TIGR04255 family)